MAHSQWEGNDLVFDGLYPVDLMSDGDRLWVLVQDEPVVSGAPPPDARRLLSIDIVTGETLSETALTASPTVMALGEDAVWVGHWGSGDVTRIDPDTGEVEATVRLELPFDLGGGPDRRLFIPNGIAIGHGSVWVGTARGAVARIDPAATRVTAMYDLEGENVSAIEVGDEGVWIAGNVGGLKHLDATSGTVTTISVVDLDHSADRLVVDGDEVYVIGDRLLRRQDGSFQISDGSYMASGEDAISRIEADTQAVADTRILDGRVVFLGWVYGFLGLLDETGVFRHLEAIPELVSQASETNWQSETHVVQVHRDAWMVDTSASRMRRLRETGPAELSLPFDIQDPSAKRPVPEDLATSADWIELDRGPLEPRWPGVVAWTGEEIVIWGGERRGGGRPVAGGAAYNPETNEWQTMSDGPLGAVPEPSWVWTGEELVIWAHRTAAAWNPADNSWREIDDWPLSSSHFRRAVWTGEEILDAESGLAVDPTTGASRPIAESPGLGERTSVVWADGHLVAVNSEGVYELAADAWATMPKSGLTSLATAGTWTGTDVVAGDYEMNAASYSPETNEWTRLPAVPLRFFECFPRAHTIKTRPVMEHCAGIGIWNNERQAWIPIAYPNVTDIHTPTLIPVDGHLYAWGSNFHRLEPGSLDRPHRLAVGISYLDLPEDWTLSSVTGGTTIEVQLVSLDDTICSISAIHADAKGVIHSYLDDEAIQTEITPHVGGEPIEAMHLNSGVLDDLYHLVWAQGTTDVIDLACETEQAAEQLAPRIWSTWQ